MQGEQKFNFTFKLIILIYVISLPIGMLKIYRIENLAFVYINFFYFSMILLTLHFLYKCLKLKKVYLDSLVIFLFLLLLQGTVVGLINENKLSYILIDSGRIIFVLSAYLWAYNANLSSTDIMVFTEKLSKYLIIAYSVIIMFSYLVALPLGMISYFSIASQRLIIPVCYYFKKKPILSLYAFILILASGKRGAAVSIVLLLSIYWIAKRIVTWYKFKKPNKKTIGIFLIGIITIITIGVTQGDTLSTRWKYLDPWSDNFNIKIASSGRFEEINGVLSTMKNDGINYFIGSGNGYTYRMEYQVGSQLYVYEGHRNVHVSLVNVFMLNGLLLTVFMFILILFKLRKVLKTVRKMPDDDREILLSITMSIAGLLIYTFFAYELFQEILIWIFLAFVNKRLVKNKQLHNVTLYEHKDEHLQLSKEGRNIGE